MRKVTIGVSQIMKNEAHVLERWYQNLSKAVDKNNEKVIDCITLVDTGSTDNSVEFAKEMGIKYNIPTYVYERPFDSFDNSRNYAMKMAKDRTLYSTWIDLDEIFQVNTKIFDKQKLDKHLYMYQTTIKNTEYTRNELWINQISDELETKDSPGNGLFRWYGPVHEFIIPNENVANILTSDLCAGITIQVQFDGASWQDPSKLHMKYREHASKLEAYIDNVDRNPRWIFYTAQSYSDSACIPNNKFENEERLRRAIKYYQERVDCKDGYDEERFYSAYRVGTIMTMLEYPWKDCKEALLKAYNLDPMRGEPIAAIVQYYIEVADWNIAYLYSKMAVNTFYKANPYPKKILFVDAALYNWRVLHMHCITSFNTGRREEAKKAYNELLVLIRTNPQFFTREDIDVINSNKSAILG